MDGVSASGASSATFGRVRVSVSPLGFDFVRHGLIGHGQASSWQVTDCWQLDELGSRARAGRGRDAEDLRRAVDWAAALVRSGAVKL